MAEMAEEAEEAEEADGGGGDVKSQREGDDEGEVKGGVGGEDILAQTSALSRSLIHILR